MLMILTSPGAVLKAGKPDNGVAQILVKAKAAGNPVALISNNAEPDWFGPTFGVSGVQFLRVKGRQSGEIVSSNAKTLKLNSYDTLVLATKAEDIQMGKNGGAVLIAAGWSNDAQVKALGIKVDDATQLQEVIDLATGWGGQWWYAANATNYRVRALADLSQYGAGKDINQVVFAEKVKNTVKNGGSRLNALLAVTARSLLMEGVGAESDLVWGVYPSSSSGNNDQEVLSDFTHRLRTTVSRVRFAKKGEPLFIRHTPSPKRSAGGGGDRTDPTGQVLTIHLNPFYRENDRLVGKHVLIIDDCTTHGVSFGVAAAFLRAAGASAVTGVALGKFGNLLRHYDILIKSSPYEPVQAAAFAVQSSAHFLGANSGAVQHALKNLIP